MPSVSPTLFASTVFATLVVVLTGCAMESSADRLTGASTPTRKKKTPTSSSSSSGASGTTPGSPPGSTPSNVTIAPVISVLQPGSVPAGSRNVSITVNGSGFGAGATVEVAGAVAPSSMDGAGLVVQVPDDKVTGSGAVGVTVVVGGLRSNTAYFSVSSPQAASLTSLTPRSTQAGSGNSVAVRVEGAGFKSTSQVVVSGRTCITSFQSATSLRATIPADLLNAATTHAVAVKDSSTGATSTTLNFTVTAPPRNPDTCEDIQWRSTCLNSGCGWYEPGGPCVTVGGNQFCEDIASRSNCLNSGCGWFEPFGPCVE